MTRSDDQRIADILDACEELDLVVTLKQTDSVPQQTLLRSAERLLEIIGEAASHVSEEGKARYPEVNRVGCNDRCALLGYRLHWL